MKRFILHIVTLLFSIVVNAQQNNIKGTIVDEAGNPVGFATAVLFAGNNTTTPVAQATAAENGVFSLAVNKEGIFVLKVFQLNYEILDQTITAAGNLDLGKIILKRKTGNLKEVVVAGNQPLISRKIDRIVMNVEDNPLAAGKSSLELFKMVPGVFVMGENISINGMGNARVMLNGKLLQLTGDELVNFLSNLKASEIASIEVIPNPPAEYDASGSGLINIVYKKQRQDGLNGFLTSSYEQGRYASFNEGGQLNYKQDKLSFFGSYNRSWEKGYNEQSASRAYDKAGYSYNYSAAGKPDYSGYRYRIGGVYDISSRQYLALEYSRSSRSLAAPSQSTTAISGEKNDQVLLRGSFPQSSDNRYENLGLNYNLKLDSIGTKLVILADYTKSDISRINDAATDYYDEITNIVKDTSYRNTIPALSKIYTADVKFTRPLSKSAALTLGGKLVNTSIDNSALFENYKEGWWTTDQARSYQFNYRESIYAGFVSYKGNIFKTAVQLGLRAEYTATDGLLVNMDKRTKKNYLDWFPSLNVQKVLNKQDDYFSLSYARRIYRPSYRQLNPFVVYVDNYTTQEGNPDLRPQYAHSLQLGYTYHNRYQLAFVYQQVSDVIQTIMLPGRQGDSMAIRYTPQNLDTRHAYSAVLYVPITVSKWWSMTNELVYGVVKYRYQDFQNSQPSVELQSDQNFKLPGGLKLNMTALYLSKFTQGNIVIDGYFRLDAGLQKSFWKDRLTAKVAMNDLFNSEVIRSTIAYDHYHITSREKRQTQSVVLQLTYNFRMGKVFTVKKMDNSNTDEKNRLNDK
ncbi:TonB-dependent receptor [Chitinophaga agrisoli]|uniref:TonB-dependent receptor n=1 Tax=Chitinophaga agrisoli TaxID=2607653 RepID=A0A5B2VZG4_9BACT|nr:outer membrane beta-barrel family protein [Chitinophaga agrisoli]KAA2243517.1 TonB-dependent receptor [Chitinophaga agrisoli]